MFVLHSMWTKVTFQSLVKLTEIFHTFIMSFHSFQNSRLKKIKIANSHNKFGIHIKKFI